MKQKIKDWFKRIFCRHAWLITGMKDGVAKFKCSKCKQEMEVGL